MKNIFFLLALAALQLGLISSEKVSVSQIHVQAFNEFKSTFSKSYEDRNEETERLQLFAQAMNEIEEHNSDPSKTFTMEVNSFADMTHEEFILKKTGAREIDTKKNPENVLDVIPTSTLPKTLDYRQQGYVSPVRNQGNCGSCGFFSDTGSIEGVVAKKNGKKVVELSKQHPGDCSYAVYWPKGNGRGMCDGVARHEVVFWYARDRGLMSEADYPYTGKNGNCKSDASKIIVKTKGYMEMRNSHNFTVEELKSVLVSVGPISVIINASPREFMYYRKGIYRIQKCDGYNGAHGLVLVGYGSENGDDFYILKNSWGTNWGENGFIRIAQDYKIPEGEKCYDSEIGPYAPIWPIL